MAEIPKQLQNPEFRFCLIRPKTKIPFEKEWQKNGYKFNDKKLLDHINRGGNYGVIGGYGNLRILDIDDKTKVTEFKSMFDKTFMIKTGSGGLHIYFTSDYNKPHILKNEMGEYRAEAMQCVGPGSTHPSGNTYDLINNEKIINIPTDIIIKVLSPYLKDINTTTKTKNEDGKTDTSPSGMELAEVIRLVKKQKTKEQIWEQMKAFTRWTEKPEAYKERTYEKAKELAKKDNEKKEKINRVSSYIDEKNQILVEEIYTKKDGVMFCMCDCKTGKITYCKSFTIGKIKYYPQVGEEIDKGVIKLPTKALEYEDDLKLDKEIWDFSYKWLDIPADFRQFCIWNTKRSWVFQRFHTLNYLRYLGDTGTGKTRGLDTFGYIHYKPIKTSGSTTPAPLFRIIDKWRGTIVMDEADLKQSDESQDIIKVINLGYEEGGFIMRCDQNNADQINFFDPYCPKILGTRKSFTDKATESRCITHVSEVTDRTDIPVELDDNFKKEVEEIRNKLLMWRFKNYFKIDLTKKYDLGDIEPRVKQIVSGYIPLFGNDEKQMEIFKNFIKTYQQDLIEERSSSFTGQVVKAIHSLIENGNLTFTTKEIVSEGEFKDFQGNIMKPQSLAGQLRSLGFKKSKSIKLLGKTKRIILLDDVHLSKLFKRYGLEKVTPVTLVTAVTALGGTPQLGIIGKKETNNTFCGVAEALPISRNRRNQCNRCNPNNWSKEDLEKLRNATNNKI